MICFCFPFFTSFPKSERKSITACGVLNKNCQSENAVRSNTASGNRRQSLTKYQIDSSEYIQPKVDESLMRSYTDYQKAKHNEYKLNIFSTVPAIVPSEISPGHTDDEREPLDVKYGNDEAISIKTAQTKNDWIQEWAKNARRCNNLLSNSEVQHYSKSSNRFPQSAHSQNKDDDQMTRDRIEQFGDGIIEYSNDECPIKKHDPMNIWSGAENFARTAVRRPPISPTKIPSPMHTHLQTRSSSMNRSIRRNNIVS